jgi:hypothetical protein
MFLRNVPLFQNYRALQHSTAQVTDFWPLRWFTLDDFKSWIVTQCGCEQCRRRFGGTCCQHVPPLHRQNCLRPECVKTRQVSQYHYKNFTIYIHPPPPHHLCKYYLQIKGPSSRHTFPILLWAGPKRQFALLQFEILFKISSPKFLHVPQPRLSSCTFRHILK